MADSIDALLSSLSGGAAPDSPFEFDDDDELPLPAVEEAAAVEAAVEDDCACPEEAAAVEEDCACPEEPAHVEVGHCVTPLNPKKDEQSFCRVECEGSACPAKQQEPVVSMVVEDFAAPRRRSRVRAPRA